MRTFYQLLVNVLIAGTTNNFVWFAITFWVFLETKSVISTGFVGGIYLVATAFSGFWFGSLVDHYKKKTVMIGASLITLIFYLTGFIIYQFTPVQEFTNIQSPVLWGLILILLFGVIAGNILNIAVPALVTILVPDEKRDKANGMFGTVTGIGFALTSVASGFILAFGGMFWVLVTAVIFTLISVLYLFFLKIPEKELTHLEQNRLKNIDIKGTIEAIKKVPGLLPLILFTTFNNLLGGVFMALMDAYGLSLVSVQVWGLLWGFLSFGIIFSGLFISKRGLGKNPLRTLIIGNIIIWINCILFTAQPWLWLLVLGSFIWMMSFPFIEAAEQTIIQKVVPSDRQGRVFGFSQSVEQAASPITSFLVGPLTQIFFIPFMSSGGKGAELIGSWFGVGMGRGIALVFIISGFIGLIVTLTAWRSGAYKQLSERYTS